MVEGGGGRAGRSSMMGGGDGGGGGQGFGRLMTVVRRLMVFEGYVGGPST